MRKRGGHFAHERNAIAMGHLVATNLNGKISLFLSAEIDGYADGFKQVAFFILKTATPHDDPARFTIGKEKAVFALECSPKSASPVVIRFRCRAVVWMNPGKNQV